MGLMTYYSSTLLLGYQVLDTEATGAETLFRKYRVLFRQVCVNQFAAALVCLWDDWSHRFSPDWRNNYSAAVGMETLRF